MLLLATGCGGGTKTVTETTTVTKTVTVHEVTTSTTVGGGGGNECSGDEMSGTFDVVPGSAGAGTIVYKLRVKNTSPVACYVSGLPQVQLIGANGAQLPTSVVPNGAAAAARITLQPGDSASADARFSPDVPGTGDQTNGQCQPPAKTLRVALAGAPLDVAVSPPTPVCESGQLQFKVFSSG